MRVSQRAPLEFRPGFIAAVCAVHEPDAERRDYFYTIEFRDGSSAHIPEVHLEPDDRPRQAGGKSLPSDYPRRSGRLSFFAAASWLVPFFVFLAMQPYVAAAEDRDARNHVFFHGFVETIIQISVAGGLAFVLGLLSIIRRERLRWMGAIPCLFGGLVVLAWVAGALERVMHFSGRTS